MSSNEFGIYLKKEFSKGIKNTESESVCFVIKICLLFVILILFQDLF